MKVPHVLVTLALVSLAVAGAIPKPGEHKDRVIDKVGTNIYRFICGCFLYLPGLGIGFWPCECIIRSSITLFDTESNSVQRIGGLGPWLLSPS